MGLLVIPFASHVLTSAIALIAIVDLVVGDGFHSLSNASFDKILSIEIHRYNGCMLIEELHVVLSLETADEPGPDMRRLTDSSMAFVETLKQR